MCGSAFVGNQTGAEGRGCGERLGVHVGVHMAGLVRRDTVGWRSQREKGGGVCAWKGG